VNAGANYRWALNSKYGAFVAADASYRDATNASLEEDPRLRIDAYTLINLNVGIRTRDDVWTLSAYGRNVTNAYYWNNAIHVQDTIVRYIGMPGQFGVTAAYRY
jgi:iron complex outermembrane receptor protein